MKSATQPRIRFTAPGSKRMMLWVKKMLDATLEIVFGDGTKRYLDWLFAFGYNAGETDGIFFLYDVYFLDHLYYILIRIH